MRTKLTQLKSHCKNQTTMYTAQMSILLSYIYEGGKLTCKSGT